MSQEEESSGGRVTRGALRRRSIDQDTSIGPGTPKKAVSAKKGPALDAILETNSGTTTESTSTRGVNKAVQKLKELEPEGGSRRSRANSLTEDVVEATGTGSAEVRRTPRRRASQDVSNTPQTAPAATRRMTRRNSVTSDDGSVTAVSTPKATTKSRLNVSVAPPTIVEDDEKDESNTSVAIPEADLSDLDIRKLRNRSISNSPVPKGSPTGKNGSSTSLKVPVEEESSSSVSPAKQVAVLLQDIHKSPKPSATEESSKDLETIEIIEDSSVVEMEPLVVMASNQQLPESVAGTPSKAANTSQSRKSVSASSSPQKLQKSVTFDEATTPERQNQSAYPRTPVPTSVEKRFKFDVEEQQQQEAPAVVKSAEKKAKSSPPDVFEIDETMHESPKESVQAPELTEKTAPTTPKKAANAIQQQKPTTPAPKTPEPIDRSLANIVDDVKENIAAAACDLSMSIVGTPKPVEKQAKGKGLLPHLREGSCSTPIAKFVSNTPDGRGQKAKDASAEGEKLSKSWTQAVKGSAGKGIDVFSVRKQEEQQREDEEAKKLNESLKESASKKRKSPKKTPRKEQDDEEDEDDDVGVSELLGGDSSQESNFMDDEAMEVDKDYESGDSMDSEERLDMEENEIPVEGESIGSEDSESDDGNDDENGEDDSFIASDNEEPELLEGSGEDLGDSDEDQNESKPKKRKRIIQVEDSSSDEKEASRKEVSTVSLERTTTASENSMVEAKSPKKTPVKVESSPKKTPAKSPLSVKESPAKSPLQTKEPEKSPAKTDPTNASEAPKSRKSMPAAAIISADFYSPAPKKSKRNTINVLANGTATEEEQPTKKQAEEKRKSTAGLLANPAALALAKKNKRMSLDQAATGTKSSDNKRASLPGKLTTEDKQLDASLEVRRKNKKPEIPEEDLEEMEPMDVDDGDDVVAADVEQVVPQKKRPKDLSEFDTDAILSRCNEIVRADKEKKKQSATLRQKKKDEKRRQRELDHAEGNDDEDKNGATAEGDDSGSPDKKKKKKKKKPINYMLEELGETKEEQVAKALKRRHALLEAKRERKKAKKAAKLQSQLNKENQVAGGIGAKFEKKTKKKDKKSVVEELVTEPALEVPKVKLAVSAFQAYKEQIADLQKESGKGRKKSKQLKEKNQQPQKQEPTALEEVQAALQPAKSKKEKSKVPDVAATEVPPTEADKPKKKKKHEKAEDDAQPEASEPKPKKVSKKPVELKPEVLAEQRKLDKELAELKQVISEPISKLVKKQKLDELAKVKHTASEPIAKVIKKQKLSQNQDAATVTCPEAETTPPRKLKALARLESGFMEEAITPEQQKLKRNHGFREEPLTPKPVGFKVSAVLPTGQQELAQRAAQTKNHSKKSAIAGRIRPENVQEPERGLPLPIWTRSGTFDVEEVPNGKKKAKKAKSFDDGYIAVNGTGKSSTEFLVKPLGATKGAAAAASKKANRIDLATVDDEVINFKKQAIFGKSAHLREKKPKH